MGYEQLNVHNANLAKQLFKKYISFLLTNNDKIDKIILEGTEEIYKDLLFSLDLLNKYFSDLSGGISMSPSVGVCFEGLSVPVEVNDIVRSCLDDEKGMTLSKNIQHN